jgi:hypothetical protein
MSQNRTCRRKGGDTALVRVALGAALATLVVCANGSAARAGDDDESSIMTKFMHTLGLRSPGALEYETNYNERSPLVVPPSKNLPAPEAVGPPPNWPKDQDVERRKQVTKEEKVKPHADWVSENQRPLRPDELSRGPAVANDGSAASPNANSSMSNPQYQGTAPKKNTLLSLDIFRQKEEYTTFTGEPTRSNLTDPPPGYLTPSPDQPYGIAPEKKQQHIQTLGERVEPTR